MVKKKFNKDPNAVFLFFVFYGDRKLSFLQ